MSLGSILLIYLLARSLPFAKRSPLFAPICALFLAISPWYIFISKDERVGLILFISVAGVYLINKFIKNYLLVSVTLFLILFNFFTISFQDITRVPVWITDEQRREHASFYNHPLVILTHNKVINYTLSFLDHYTQHFQGDFLFISGDVRDSFALMYLFDFVFIIMAIVIIIKNLPAGRQVPQGWGIIFIWLVLAPLPSALDFQPPNAMKSFNMIVPLIILSSFGASYIFQKIIRV